MTTTTTTAASTATATRTSAVQTATKSLLTSLGTGSGIDTATLVTSLVEAQFAARTAQLTAKADTLTAQISGVSTVRNAITGFATALDTLAKGGTLATQPKSSSTAVLSASALTSGTSASLAATVRVDRLASGQSTASAKIMAGGAPATRTTAIGSGTFTLALGEPTYATDANGVTTMTGFTAGPATVSFALDNASVDTIAAAINDKAKGLGISASVVTGADGSAYLSLKGATGSARAFNLTTSGDASLAQFAVGEGSTVVTAARNAALTVNGVPVERASNTIDDLVQGVKLELAGTGTTTLSASRSTAALTQAVADVAETYNSVLQIIQEQTDAKTGKLYGDAAAQGLLKRLKDLTLATIGTASSDGAPTTLAGLGVKTARDGTLSVDTAQLVKVLAAHPDAVETMFRASTASTGGLPAMLQSMATAASSSVTGLGASTARYTAEQGKVATAQTRIAAESETATTRLTNQFSGMNARVTAYKSVQSFLTNQIAAWNKSDS